MQRAITTNTFKISVMTKKKLEKKKSEHKKMEEKMN